MTCVFYATEPEQPAPPAPALAPSYSFELWRPTWRSPMPPGVRGPVFAAWWLLHSARLFGNRDYSAALILRGKTVVHRSCIFPRYFRFPFMASGDLQIGDTWTLPEDRGRGLAVYALCTAVALQRKPGRRFWYVTEADNIASIRVAEKAGFKRVGEGERTRRFGLGLLGRFVIRAGRTQSSQASSST